MEPCELSLCLRCNLRELFLLYGRGETKLSSLESVKKIWRKRIHKEALVDEAVLAALGVEEETLDQGWIIDKPFDPDKIEVTTEQ